MSTKNECEPRTMFLGDIGKFKPNARYNVNDVIVMTKNCSYTSVRVSPWLEMFWENHRPWFWKKSAGFSVYCPPELGVRGEVPVTVVLDRIIQVTSSKNALGRYGSLVYSLAKGIKVQMPS